MKKTEIRRSPPPSKNPELRREFLKNGGKILAYSVPLIATFQAKPINAQAMTGSSLGSPDPAELNDIQTPDDYDTQTFDSEI